jgi:Domain of unknown function (DUF4126)
VKSALNLLTIAPGEQAAFVVVTSFAAGLNVYATVATLGLLARAGLVTLPPTLEPVAGWWVIGWCLALFAVEAVADKVPAFDLLWNTVQTFVRVPVAALLAYGATAQLSPWAQLLSTALGAAIAFAAHSAKVTARVAVTPSPEPFSNIALSAGEDGLAIGLMWFVTRHPVAAAAIVVALLAVIAALARAMIRAFRTLARGRTRAVDPRG